MEVVRTNPKRPLKAVIERAARIILGGGIVAFPTETVYGLGASAFDSMAVRRVFRAKGRPADNPVIVHIASLSQLDSVAEIPDRKIKQLVRLLIRRFWPGPLTLILKKRPAVAKEVTAGLDTVAVRMPSNRIALELVRHSCPIAAPSANRSGRPSPTSAAMVLHDMKGRGINLIIDGGRTRHGLESTVFDVRTRTVLRPGPVTLEQLRKIVPDAKFYTPTPRRERPISPGMKYRHYAPQAELLLFTSDQRVQLIRRYKARILNSAIMAIGGSKGRYAQFARDVFWFGSPQKAAKELFHTFAQIDQLGYDAILCEAVAERGIGAALMNRLRKAASRIVE